MRHRLLASAVLSLALASSVCAQEHPAPIFVDQPHHFSVFLGSSDNDHGTAFTLGLDYEYRATEFLGLGGIVEHAFEEIDATTALLVADLHLTHQFIVQTGPGVEFLHEEDEAEFVYRVGVLYEWEFGGTTVSPQLHYDWAEEEQTVLFGLAFGLCF